MNSARSHWASSASQSAARKRGPSASGYAKTNSNTSRPSQRPAALNAAQVPARGFVVRIPKNGFPERIQVGHTSTRPAHSARAVMCRDPSERFSARLDRPPGDCPNSRQFPAPRCGSRIARQNFTHFVSSDGAAGCGKNRGPARDLARGSQLIRDDGFLSGHDEVSGRRPQYSNKGVLKTSEIRSRAARPCLQRAFL